eukprot:PITA_06920
MNSIRLVISLAISFKLEVHQMDVKFSFLHGNSHEEIYMEQPPGFIQIDSNLVHQLKKSLYGIKQAPQAWYAEMDSFLLDTGFSRCPSDNIVYTKKVGKSLIILVLYVDDLILTGNDPNLINHVNSSLKKQFEMTNLGHLHYFLGLQVLQSKEGISLSQSKYACDLIRHFHMEDCKPTPSPFQSGFKLSVTCTSPKADATFYCQLVGKLLYLTHTRHNLSFFVALIARFMKNPHESHWKAAKRILRYVRAIYLRCSGNRLRKSRSVWLQTSSKLKVHFLMIFVGNIVIDGKGALKECKDQQQCKEQKEATRQGATTMQGVARSSKARSSNNTRSNKQRKKAKEQKKEEEL